MKGIEQAIDRANSGQVVIVTSVLTNTEILLSRMTHEQKDRFQKVFSSPNFQLCEVTRRISEKAAIIREAHDTRTFDPNGTNVTAGSVITLVDSIHLATALYSRVSEFQTLDGAGKRKRKTDLLALSDNVAGARLRIVMPKYIEPPKHLEGPIEAIGSSGQIDLALVEVEPIEPPRDTDATDATATGDVKPGTEDENKESTSVASPTDVRPIPDGPAEDPTGAGERPTNRFREAFTGEAPTEPHEPRQSAPRRSGDNSTGTN